LRTAVWSLLRHFNHDEFRQGTNSQEAFYCSVDVKGQIARVAAGSFIP
jgi:hypothetical protein